LGVVHAAVKSEIKTGAVYIIAFGILPISGFHYWGISDSRILNAG
jgi:hypothetical protein